MRVCRIGVDPSRSRNRGTATSAHTSYAFRSTCVAGTSVSGPYFMHANIMMITIARVRFSLIGHVCSLRAPVSVGPTGGCRNRMNWQAYLYTVWSVSFSCGFGTFLPATELKCRNRKSKCNSSENRDCSANVAALTHAAVSY